MHRSVLPGTTMEVDFGESWVEMAGAPCKVKYLVATLPYSNAYFAKAYPVERLESLLDGIESALRYFGGVVERVVLDYVPGNIVVLMCPRTICGSAGGVARWSKAVAASDGHITVSTSARG